jgi:hypothetical protein
MKSPVLRAPSMRSQDLVDLGERSEDVGRSAQLGQCELNASSRGLPGFEEDEFMLVRNDQSCRLAHNGTGLHGSKDIRTR